MKPIEKIFDKKENTKDNILVFKLIGILFLVLMIPTFSKSLHFVLLAVSSQTTFNLIYYFIGAVTMCFVIAILFIVGTKLLFELKERRWIWQKKKVL